MKKIYLIILVIVGVLQQAAAQFTVRGTVFDSTGTYPVQAVSVLASNGAGTTTNANGDYSIAVAPTDSIWFSYLNKPTRKFPVGSIKTPFAFNISLQTFVELLPDVKARIPDYKRDSIQNRQDYAKIFDYQRPGLRVSSLSDGTVGFDLNAIIESFQFRKNKRMAAFQNRLISEEQEQFILHRFNKALIRRITKIDSDSTLSQFIMLYQPSFLFASTANDYTFHKYIKDSYERFQKGLPPDPLWREGATSEEAVLYRRFDEGLGR